MRILLIEDEVILLDGIQAGLRLSGDIVDCVVLSCVVQKRF